MPGTLIPVHLTSIDITLGLALYQFLLFHCFYTHNGSLGILYFPEALREIIERSLVITTAQLHSTKLELSFCTGSNSAQGVSEIRNGEDL